MFGIVLCVFMIVNAIEVNTIPAGWKPALGTGQAVESCGVYMKISKRGDIWIDGGKPAEKDQWPWMAALLRDGNNQYCGGSLITDQHILTASHCVGNYGPASVAVRLAGYNFKRTKGGEKDFEVEKITMHPNKDLHDIAVLKLKKKIQFTNSISPICLPSKEFDLEDQDSYVTGWGRKSFGGVFADVLSETIVPIWNNATCESVYQHRAVNTTFQLCAGLKEGGTDSCQGDSGGPLMYQGNGRWTVIGLVSWEFQCVSAGKPSVYIRVSHYVSWIESLIKADGISMSTQITSSTTTDSINANMDEKPQSCGVHFKTELRIVNGSALAKKDVYPWMAALFLKKYTNGFPECGAVLITDRHVLTAAHCVYNFKAADIMIRLGEHDLKNKDGDERDFAVEKIVVHGNYDTGTQKNDIAVLKLNGIIPQSMKSISSICLPPNVYDMSEKGCYVSGWGRIEYGGPQSSVLHEVILKVWPDNECKNVYENRTDSDIQLCAGSNTHKDSCQGDSGGPLIYLEDKARWTLVGLVSFGGAGCGRNGIPGVYTRVSAYLPWIRRAIL